MEIVDASVMNWLCTQAQSFQQTRPYPWIRISAFLYPEKFINSARISPIPSCV
ncbi:hypothetical protein GGI1_22736, partial [Acidithiobacillus sp. GGI-221]